MAVQKRRTKNFRLREDLTRARSSVAVTLPPLAPPTFASWEAFAAAWDAYTRATKTLFRRRSSCSTAIWNAKFAGKKPLVPPEQFAFATMAYWCTHGCMQSPRGTGMRARSSRNRFTGCAARLTADVVRDKDGAWCVRVRNQITVHNHRISDQIYHCYVNNSTVPDRLLLGETDAVAADDGSDSAEPGDNRAMMASADEDGGEDEEEEGLSADDGASTTTSLCIECVCRLARDSARRGLLPVGIRLNCRGERSIERQALPRSSR